MWGGSDNKTETSGRGAGNQSSQGFGQAADHGKSSHGGQTGEKPSVLQKKKADQSSGATPV